MNTHVGLSAHLLAGQAGYRSAGINGYIYNLIRALPDVDADFSYTVMAGHQGHVPVHERLTVRRTPWSTEKPSRRIVWEQAIQPFALARVQPDLVHALAFVAPVANNIPTVVTVYDLSFIHYPNRLPAVRRLYLRTLARWSCRRAQRVIAISQSTADDVIATFGIPRANVDIAVPGVADEFRPLPQADVDTFRRQKGLPDRFILFVGTLEPRKNLPVLLRAYGRLPARDRAAVHLVLAGGKGWMFDDIFSTIDRLDLGDTVHLPGYLPAADLPLWYNAAEVFVYPSVFEGFGLPVIEAMACGTPAMVSDGSSLPEAAGDTGYRLPPDDVAAWSDALAHVIHDPDWRRAAGERARARAAQFTWTHTAAQTVASYRRALNRCQEDVHA
ncbi:MAG: glycosyltransferase family 4 protein [Anaerolineae bacterium]|nr:glycosyltransferase family 4 protein [Anaerolineae bacterium]